jgi:hypothetical protein
MSESGGAAATAVGRPESMVCPLKMSVRIELTTFTADGLCGYGTYLQTRTFPIGAPCFHAGNTHVSIGVHHERFLHHRRHRRRSVCRRFFRAARLNKIVGGACKIMNSSREPSTASEGIAPIALAKMITQSSFITP